VAQFGAANAGWLAFRNDSPILVIVQTASPGPNGQPRRNAAHQLNPREAAWDQVTGQGPKTVTVYDAKGRELCRETVNFAGKDLFFSVQVELNAKDKTLKAKLIPVPDPRGGPAVNPGLMPGNPGITPIRPGLMPGIPGFNPLFPGR
jgi:hypothetical protein